MGGKIIEIETKADGAGPEGGTPIGCRVSLSSQKQESSCLGCGLSYKANSKEKGADCAKCEGYGGRCTQGTIFLEHLELDTSPSSRRLANRSGWKPSHDIPRRPFY